MEKKIDMILAHVKARDQKYLDTEMKLSDTEMRLSQSEIRHADVDFYLRITVGF